MRLWSLHPKYLDAKGLVALWREGLLAQKVLQGRTRGYRHHPQLERFRKQSDPGQAMATYLWYVLDEACARGYQFDKQKILGKRADPAGSVTTGQLGYELEHLRAKLKARDPSRYSALTGVLAPEPHPFFKAIPGKMEPWEKP